MSIATVSVTLSIVLQFTESLRPTSAIFSQGENPAVYGGRGSDTCWPVHRWHSGRIFHGNPQLL